MSSVTERYDILKNPEADVETILRIRAENAEKKSAINRPVKNDPSATATGPGGVIPRRSTFTEEPRQQSRYRNLVFTLNNPSVEEWDHIWGSSEFSYLVMGKEFGKSGTPHIQGYGEFVMQQRFNNVKRILGKRAWFQPRFGSPKQASDYCKEDGNFTERGRLSVPGAASVIADYRDQITTGVHVDIITMEQPHIYHQYGRTLNRVQTLHYRGMKREWMTKGIWYYGPTGTGKSYTALKDYSVDTHYVWPNDGMWCDGYRGQEIVIINDYRGTMAELQYQDLLNMVDWTPYWVRRRGEEPIPFLAKTVIVTSSMSPVQLWQGKVGGLDSIDQLLRRFTVHLMAVPFCPNVSESSGVILNPEKMIEEKRQPTLEDIRLKGESRVGTRGGAWGPNGTTEIRKPAFGTSTMPNLDLFLAQQKARNDVFRPLGQGRLTMSDIIADLPKPKCELEIPDG